MIEFWPNNCISVCVFVWNEAGVSRCPTQREESEDQGLGKELFFFQISCIYVFIGEVLIFITNLCVLWAFCNLFLIINSYAMIIKSYIKGVCLIFFKKNSDPFGWFDSNQIYTYF